MGCYDTVHFRCPSCGSPQSQQTKAGGCDLHNYDIHTAPLGLLSSLEPQDCEGCNQAIHFSERHLYLPYCPCNESDTWEDDD